MTLIQWTPNSSSATLCLGEEPRLSTNLVLGDFRFNFTFLGRGSDSTCPLFCSTCPLFCSPFASERQSKRLDVGKGEMLKLTESIFFLLFSVYQPFWATLLFLGGKVLQIIFGSFRDGVGVCLHDAVVRSRLGEIGLGMDVAWCATGETLEEKDSFWRSNRSFKIVLRVPSMSQSKNCAGLASIKLCMYLKQKLIPKTPH